MALHTRILLMLFTLLCSVPIGKAHAHNINVFAMSDGNTIEGYVYFTGGSRAQHAHIELRDKTGQTLFSSTTDEQGSFALRVSHRADYVVFTNTGDGHVAEFKLYANEFGENLPLASPNDPITVTTIETTIPDHTGLTLTTLPSKASRSSQLDLSSLSKDELSGLINRAVARQIGPLRQEVNAYRNDVRMSDVMGGIGVIIGIFGVCAWVVARRKNAR
ncbi:MAG: carboxypeptidase-like regulatory domain-containing protein [Rhodospirillales bacterium]|nr:carboxypeptidase-like regulatory domain-containing protein [Rhodospirillales bacterium]